MVSMIIWSVIVIHVIQSNRYSDAASVTIPEYDQRCFSAGIVPLAIATRKIPVYISACLRCHRTDRVLVHRVVPRPGQTSYLGNARAKMGTGSDHRWRVYDCSVLRSAG